MRFVFCGGSILTARKMFLQTEPARSCLSSLFFPFRLSVHASVLSGFGGVRFFATLCTVPPGSYVYGILQARTLEWVATPSSRDLPEESSPRLLHALHWQAGSLSPAPPGKPSILVIGDLSVEIEIISKFSSKSSLLIFTNGGIITYSLAI